MNQRTEIIVIDTGPLILLGKIDALAIAGQLPVSFVSPPGVREELEQGIPAGHPAIAPPWLEIRRLRSPVSTGIRDSLDRGEAEVIQLALDYGIQDVCLDDRRGRSMAKAVGLRVVGLLGLLARAKLLGLVPRLAPLTERLLKAGGRYSPALIRTFLSEYGE